MFNFFIILFAFAKLQIQLRNQLMGIFTSPGLATTAIKNLKSGLCV